MFRTTGKNDSVMRIKLNLLKKTSIHKVVSYILMVYALIYAIRELDFQRNVLVFIPTQAEKLECHVTGITLQSACSIYQCSKKTP